ncbi:hypothetical protein G7A72_15965 [Flavobacterium sp. Sr18]|jgi:hypothetical protein|nr:hypothetical protein G7A72_15965 [Flavobacterium sp. Sr18]
MVRELSRQGQNREINHWREFYEELIEGKAELLSKEDFPYVNYNLLGRATTPVKEQLVGIVPKYCSMIF